MTAPGEFYLRGGTLQAIQTPRQDVGRCDTFRDVKVKQVGSVSEKRDRQK